MNTHLKRLAAATAALAAVATPAFALTGADEASRLAPSPTPAAALPVAAVSSAQAQAIPALRPLAGGEVTKAVRDFAAHPETVERFGPNADLARPVRPPRGGAQPWAVIPGRDSVCLTSGEHAGGTCAPLAEAAAGGLYLQLITPPDREHAVPPPGQPVTSTIIGVAPDGVSSVSATTLDGRTVKGEVGDGMYTIAGTDLAQVTLGGAKPRKLRFR